MAKNESLARVPVHVGIIMDGNGRWAKERGLPRLLGHRAGTKNLRRVIRAAADAGVKYISFYAFSTENWKRPNDEVSGLMDLLAEFIDNEVRDLHKENARLLHIGHLDGLSPTLKKKVENAVELTKDNTRINVIIAFNYGGRDEIITGIRKLIAQGVPAEEVTDEKLSSVLFTADIPDPDLIIRTSGEQRTSNFMIWQAAYSEWSFPKTYWPDFDEKALLQDLENFAQRERRFGAISEQL
ncbi:MAG: di-trans,poly-cis-decaprenylcistransferase [Chloroflexi bacterium]|nr:di-trans,poly-cis-decaprenylcistransferase [Chloroflexota bacterium]